MLVRVGLSPKNLRRGFEAEVWRVEAGSPMGRLTEPLITIAIEF